MHTYVHTPSEEHPRSSAARRGRPAPRAREARRRRQAALTAATQRVCAEALEGRTLLATVSGPLVEWKPVTVDFAGPASSELSNSPNPFLDYRLQVTFQHDATGKTYNVPGYFDGDGQGGGAGDVWRVRFTPDEPGQWSYAASFREGAQVAVDLNPDAGTPTDFDGEGGSFTVDERDPNAPGFLGAGRLEYAGGHYYKFRDGGAFVKGGVNSPENFLGYSGFDNTPGARHDYNNHVQDWAPGDPDWGGGKGKAIIGALNYLSATGVNSIYFLSMNVGGDAKDTHPWSGSVNVGGTASNDNVHYDLSKLRQWDTVFAHAQRKGIALHVVLSEAEGRNKTELDGGVLGVERKLYYRELAARFGYHNAWQWNIAEEYNYKHPWTPEAVKEFAQYIRDVDPYDHPITVHAQGDYDVAWAPFLGDGRFEAISYQETASTAGYGAVVQDWRARSTAAGRPIIVSMDELQSTSTSNLDSQRSRILWPTLLSGGHVEWYVGSEDTSLDDFRKYGSLYTWTGHALDFMNQLPVDQMSPADELLTGERSNGGGGQVLALRGQVYAISLPIASSNGELDLSDAPGKTFTVRWFNPRTGQFEGSERQVQGGGSVAVGLPPHSSGDDWVVLFRAEGPGSGTEPPSARPGGPYSVPEGGTVRLDGSGSTASEPGGALGYAWDLDGDNVFGETGAAAAFGDETTASPTFNAGALDGPTTRTVRLRVTDDEGRSDTQSTTVTVGNVAPTANAGADASVVIGSPVTLAGNATDPGAGDALTYEWVVRNAGGTVVATGAAKSFTFTPSAAGTYTATLTVRDDDGATDTDTATVTASEPDPVNTPPVITELNVPSTVTEGSALTVSGTFSDPDAHFYHIVEAEWGDGWVDWFEVWEPSFEFSRWFDDDASGQQVVVRVYDDAGAVGADAAPFTVVNARPTANAGADRSVTAGAAVSLGGSYSDPGALDWHSFLWQVKNSAGTVVASSAQQSFNFTPSAAGTYTATFTVTDDDGASHSDSATVTATPPAPPPNTEPTITALNVPAQVTEGGTVTVSGTFADPDAHDFYVVSLDWGDGEVESVVVAQKSFSFARRFEDDQDVDVQVTVEDDAGEFDQAWASAAVVNAAPSANAGADKSVTVGTAVSLTGSFGDAGSQDTHAFLWQVRNSSGTLIASSTQQAFNFTPPAVGTYTATFTVTDDDGASRSDSAVISATPAPNAVPVITALNVPSQVTEGGTLTVSGTFSDPNAHGHYVVELDWGDGTVESVQVTQKSFSFTRQFDDDRELDLQVTVEDDLGAADSQSASAAVVNAAPSANAGADKSVTAGTPVALGGSFDDAGDDDTHGFRWEVRNAGGTVVATSTQQAFNFTPTGAGTYTATFTVTDDDGGADSDSAVITVAAPAPASNAWIASLTLINADTDQPILTLSEGMTLNLATLPTRRLNVRVDIANGVTVKSVRFGLDGDNNYRTESDAPFAMAGDSDGDYRPWTPSLGAHVLNVTPYSGTKASGTKGPTLTVNFTVIDQVSEPEPEPEPQPPAAPTGLSASPASTSRVNLTWTDRAGDEQGYVVERRTEGTQFAQIASLAANATAYNDTGLEASTKYYYRVRAVNAAGPSAYSAEVSATTFAPEPPPDEEPPPELLPTVTAVWLVDADSDETVLKLVDGMTIRRSDIDVSSFNVLAETNDLARSVRFGYNGDNSFRVESEPPFAMFGDSDGDFRGETLAAGTYTITVTAYTATRGGGTAGESLTIRFTVV